MDLPRVYANPAGRAFAAVKHDGSVVTWRDAVNGGNSDSVKSELTGGVDRVVGAGYAFAAVKQDGSVVTWCSAVYGGESGSVKDQLTGDVDHVVGTCGRFRRREAGWFRRHLGRCRLWRQLQQSQGSADSWCSRRLCEQVCFCRREGRRFRRPVVGQALSGGNSHKVRDQLTGGVRHVAESMGAFAAVKEDGSGRHVGPCSFWRQLRRGEGSADWWCR